MTLYQSMYFVNNNLIKADWFECTNDGLAFKYKEVDYPKDKTFTVKAKVPDLVAKPDQLVPAGDEIVTTSSINWDNNKRM